MANGGANLRVRISADLADIKQGMALLRGELAKAKKDAGKVTPDAASWSAGLSEVRKRLISIGAAYAALRAVRWYTEMSDQASNLAGRLKLATKSQEEFARAYKQTYAIAQQGQADWSSVVNLFAQLTQTTGQSQERILNLTKIISQAFRVSGASAQDTSNGLRQLQQAMAGGVLRAEEFNTIIETSPRIVQALADHFGISFGKVRQYVKDGKVSTQEFMLALEKSSGKIQSDFDQLPKTVAGSVQEVRNALLAMVSDTNTATGASGDLAKSISDLARTLESDSVKSGFQTIISLIAEASRVAAIGAAKIGEYVSAYKGWLADRGFSEGKTVDQLEVRRDKLVNFRGTERGQVFNLSGSIDKEISRIDNLIEDIKLRQKAIFSDEQSIPESMLKSVQKTAAGSDGKAKKQVAESNALLRDSVSRALAELDRMYKDSEVGLHQYFQTRRDLQQQAIDLEIEQTRYQLAVTKDLGQRKQLEEKIVMLQRDRADAATAAAREEQKAADDVMDKLGEIRAQLEELDGNTGAAARIRIFSQFHDQLQKLEADSDEVGKKMVNNLIDRLINKAQAEQIANKVGKATGLLSTQEQSISAQMDAGTLGYVEGERRLKEERAKALEQLRALRSEQQAYLDTLKPDSPDMAAAIEGLANIDAAIANTVASQQKFRQDIADQGVSALTGFFDDLIDGATSFKDAFRSMVAEFAAGVAKMIAQQLALRAVQGIMNSFGGGAVGAFHGGGIAGAARLFRSNINPMVFGAAPRYHGGGIAGLAPNEVPAILERGERIRTVEQERALQAQLGAARGGGTRTPEHFILALTDDQVASAMSGAAGEKVTVLHARNNRGAIESG